MYLIDNAILFFNNQNFQIDADVDFPSNILVKVSHTAKFTQSSASVMTFNRTIDAPDTQIFFGSYNVSWVDVNYIKPVWSDGDATEVSVQIKKALVLGGEYYTNNVTLSDKNVAIITALNGPVAVTLPVLGSNDIGRAYYIVKDGHPNNVVTISGGGDNFYLTEDNQSLILYWTGVVWSILSDYDANVKSVFADPSQHIEFKTRSISETQGSVKVYIEGDGDLNLTDGHVRCTAGDVIADAGDIKATLGDIEATAGSVTAGDGISITGGDLNLGAASIKSTNGVLIDTNNLTLDSGNLEVTTGSITAGNGLTLTGGNIDIGSAQVSGTGDITVPTNNVVLSSGSLTLTDGDLELTNGNFSNQYMSTNSDGLTCTTLIEESPVSGTVLRTFVYDMNELLGLSGAYDQYYSFPSNSNDRIADVSYTPISDSSYLVIEYMGYIFFQKNTSSGTSWAVRSRIYESSAANTILAQQAAYTVSGKFEGPALPIMHRYTNSDTSQKTFQLGLEKERGSDLADVYNLGARITEIQQ